MEAKDSNGWGIMRSSHVVLAFAAIAGLLYYGRPVLLPFVLAVFAFSMFSPVLDWLVLRLRFPRWLAMPVSFTFVLVVVAAFFIMVGEAVRRVVTTASAYGDDLATMAEQVFHRAQSLGMPMDPEELVPNVGENLATFVADMAWTGFDMLSLFLLTLIFVFFLLASRNPHEVRKGVYAQIDRDVRRYLLTKTALSAVMGTVVGLVLWAFNIELAVVFGLLAFVLDFIPSIGSVIATVLPMPMAMAQFQDSLLTVVFIIAILGAVQIILGNFVEPKVLGSSLHLHPIAVLLAIGFWGLVWGIIGALLAVPLTAVLRLVAMRIESLHPLARLLGGRIPDIKDTH